MTVQQIDSLTAYEMLKNNKNYIKENNWNNTASKYLNCIKDILKSENIIEIN